MTFDEAIDRILYKNCILFTGAGFSIGSTNFNNESPKTAKVLCKLLYDQCGLEQGDDNLMNASELFVDQHGTAKLIDLLKKEYTIKSVSNDQQFIADLPWKRIYTTNYDNILELASHNSKKLITPATLIDQTNEYKDKRVLSIHLNGYIERLTDNTIHKEFKLTNASYLAIEFNQSPWLDLFRSDLCTADAIFYIGFSCASDLDLSRIIYNNAFDSITKSFFIVSPTESKISEITLNKFGNVEKIGASGFVNSLLPKLQNINFPEKPVYVYKSFYEAHTDYFPSTPKDLDFYNLMLFGDYKTSLILNSLTDATKFPYYIKREEFADILEKIKGGISTICIHSDLGNGKTLFLAGLSLYLKQLGYEVYSFKKYYDITNEEIERICSIETKHVIIIDSYSSHLDLIKRIQLFRNPNTIVICSERTLIHDTVYYTLEDIIGHSPQSWDLNELNNSEVLILIDLFNQYGLWGSDASFSRERKRLELINKFRGSIRLILLDLLKSPDIRNRLNSIIEPLKDNKPFYHATLFIIASNILGFELDLDEVVFCLDSELFNNPSFYNNTRLKEIIDFDSRNIRVRSSIIAEAVLSNNEYAFDLVNILTKVVKRLDNHRYNKNVYNILRNIVSHSRLSKLINATENKDAFKLVIQFFEEIKNLKYCKTNPFFWLQYAIARLSIRDYKIADKYFETAYSYASDSDTFDTFQIDNHYARHILENEIFNGDIDTCMPRFVKAHEILSNRIDKNKNRHYPIKVAKNYARFYEHFYNKLQDHDKNVFLVSCQEIINRIESYKKVTPDFRTHPAVLECESLLSDIVIKERQKELFKK